MLVQIRQSQFVNKMVFRYLPLVLCYFLAFLLDDVRSSSSGSVTRASSHHPYESSNKLSVKDLALELAKAHLLKMIESEHADLDKAKESADRCTNIKSVGKPVTHNARHYVFGNWMKDPLGIMGAETIIVMENDKNDINFRNGVEKFKNMNMFKAGMPDKTYTLPYRWDGTGAVVYGPYLYYNRENSAVIIKYNLHTQLVEATISVSGYTARKTGYQWCGGTCGMDLAVDEQGLWVLWGSTGNSGKLHASKIDVNRNLITHTWTLNTEPMSTMSNAFVACGVIYCIDDRKTNPTTINFAYDTKTGKQWNPNIQFTNQYGANSMVDYNPRDKVLYAWDNRRQVTYPITFEKEVSSK